VFKGKTTDLLAGLDFAELGLTGVVLLRTVLRVVLLWSRMWSF